MRIASMHPRNVGTAKRKKQADCSTDQESDAVRLCWWVLGSKSTFWRTPVTSQRNPSPINLPNDDTTYQGLRVQWPDENETAAASRASVEVGAIHCRLRIPFPVVPTCCQQKLEGYIKRYWIRQRLRGAAGHK
ncbi:hypothetical protein THAOC_03684 [Thalassiosira oceanica]|uniref:Uncharacterized protein n=1 Tax=Thalassiosira oceanica TaxID=159749 RepID=K0T784_THAOC|nr:hypothetical protein THAOC_03684 [Thalassiosira oceanica]|eukprot:EJK74628.1 hypothetical protein THAOC_03684 [Thalassiosira oceanica]